LSADFSAPEFRSLATDLRKQAAASSDSVRRRVARRVLQGAMIGAMETGRQLLAEKKFADAIRQYELAAAIRPDRPGVRIELARACLHGGDR
ncbi:tetratricopeptide repeat protein, partial [Enterococcus faecium]|uniref:tetratricopeptide repeat protein n=1 Tax=Enterococcus faecium TaxID=1352 RepID=UPI003F41C761